MIIKRMFRRQKNTYITMNTLLQKLIGRKETKQLTAVEQYRNLLAKLVETEPSEPTEKDVELLDTLTDKLRLSPQDVDDDMDTMRTLAKLLPLAADNQRLNQIWRDAHKLQSSELEKIETAHKLAIEQHHEKYIKPAGRARTDWEASNAAQGEIDKIKGRSPHLIEGGNLKTQGPSHREMMQEINRKSPVMGVPR